MRLDNSNSKVSALSPRGVEQLGGEDPAAYISLPSPELHHNGFNKGSENGALTFSEYIRVHFAPEHIALKSNPGRRHYHAILKHVIGPSEVEVIVDSGEPSRSKLAEDPTWPYVGRLRLQQISPENVQGLIDAATRRGYSAQTIRHIRNVVRSVFTHAARQGAFAGVNPAAAVSIPDSGRGELHVLSLAQTVELLARMRYPEREVALMAILTNLTISEICGLQWKDVNLSDHPVTREGLLIPSRHLAIRVQRYRGELCPVPPARRKFIPIPPLLHRVLRNLNRQSAAGWQDCVLTTRSGKPINQINLAVRALKRIGRQMDMPWISWQVFRRTRLNILREYEASIQDQISRVIFPGIQPIRPSEMGSLDGAV